MKIQNTQQLSQSQNLAMTPRLQQAIKFLQMNNLELTLYLQQEISMNPLLELEHKDIEKTDYSAGDFDDFHDDTWDYYNDDERPDFEQNIKSERSLTQYLMEQLHAAELDDMEKKIGEYLIYQLSANGYLEESIGTLADNIGVTEQALSRVLDKLKTFDPVGIFACSVSENLTIQLQDMGAYDADMQKIMPVLDHLTMMDFKSFCKKVGMDPKLCGQKIQQLKQLNPYPARGFCESHDVIAAIPEASIRFNEKGEPVAFLNEETLPKVLMNSSYLDELKTSSSTKEEKTFVSEQYNHANWLINALLQRSQNLLAVCSAIATRQKLFFKQGISALKPLTLKDLAKDTNLHESTISRLTTGRFISTPMGTLDAKFFFSQSLKPEKNLIDISARYVQERIHKHVQHEDKKCPLSDDDIVKILSEEGINIARRTISKYRKGLNIMPSHQRRQAYDRENQLRGV